MGSSTHARACVPDVQLHEAAQKYSGKDDPPPDQPDNRFYFISPDGEFLKAFPAEETTKDITDFMVDTMQSYKINNPAWHGPKKVARRHA